MSAAGGRLTVQSDVLGRFEVQGEQTRCLYVDMLAGARTRMRVEAVANNPTQGVSPEFALAEYGPSGPYWYNILAVQCRGQYGPCDRGGADAWQASLAGRRRGRMDPCGSSVVKALAWDTSNSESSRDGAFFHDFAVSFDLEIKTFETRFAPGSTECVPK